MITLNTRLGIDLALEFWENSTIAIFRTFPFSLYLLLVGVILCDRGCGQDKSATREVSRSRELPKTETVGRRAEESQIRVYSKHPLIKAHFDSYSRELRSQFRHMLGLYKSDDWKVHFEVYLYGTGDDVYSGTDIMTSAELNAANQFTIITRVKIHDRFKEETYRLTFIRMLLLEQMLEAYLENPNSFSAVTLSPPDWLIHGFDFNLRHKQLGRPSYFYSGFLKSGQLMKVSEIMQPNRARGLNPLSLELFRASSAILVGALCDQKDGGESLRAMLQDMALRPDYNPDSLIRKHFPAFRETGQGIDKWWALQLATLSQQQSFEYYSPAQTEKYLEQALQVSFAAIETPSVSAKKANPTKAESLMDRFREKMNRPDLDNQPAYQGDISRYREFLGRAEANGGIAHRQATLFALKVKAFPLFYDVIDRYAVVCGKLLKRDFDGLDKELKELSEMRKQILDSLEKSRDYLNYYEATRSPERSDAFDSYLNFKDRMKGGALPKRTDPISTYMEKIERQIPLFSD